jgi:IS30 family transposase
MAHLNPQAAEQRKRIAARIKARQPEVSNRQIARTLGVAEGTIRNDTAQNYAASNKKPNKNNEEKPATAQNYAHELSGPQAAKLAEKRATAKFVASDE